MKKGRKTEERKESVRKEEKRKTWMVEERERKGGK